MSAYKKAMREIKASEEFKRKMKKEMSDYKQSEKRFFMKKVSIFGGSLVACAMLVFFIFFNNANNEVALDLTDRIEVDPNAPAASVMLNIEGYITEVSEDGLSFTLDNGMQVVVTEETKLGIDGPTAAPKDEQLFEPTFREGNLIGGFAENSNENPVKADAIFTNWNFEDPIR
ncbi:hypothetical protein BTS2_0349 [Bacillus sp. TS-2]|nr:hypothetical protein BTS2_0349 [Bacillus sp. TS-2]